MSLFVFLTAFLYQIGSAESKKFPEDRSKDEVIEDQLEQDYTQKKRQHHPILWRLYENSLTLSLCDSNWKTGGN